MRLSRIGHSTAKALTILNGVQALEIFRVVLPWLDVEIDGAISMRSRALAPLALVVGRHPLPARP